MHAGATPVADPSFTIPKDHPSIPGHFPGKPVVPGAVLLDHAMALTERRIGQAIDRVITAKFPRPLLPGTPCSLELETPEHGQVRLRCVTGEGAVLVAVFGYGNSPDMK
jgi:3-hydroxymyristoyl/3-hydroxydecanoyl-(acyl carrier protein) dehydratase